VLTYLAVGMLFLTAPAKPNDPEQPKDPITVELVVPKGATAKTRQDPDIQGELKITNNTPNEIIIFYLCNVKSNLITAVEASDGKCVAKTDYAWHYVDPGFKIMSIKIAPIKSLTDTIDLMSPRDGWFLDPGEYKATAAYRYRNTEFKSNTVTFTVPKNAPKDRKELRELEKSGSKK
jgi:hypothetical protein